MSRFCGDMNAEPILNAAEIWKNSALMSDGSVLSQAELWSMSNLRQIEVNFVERPDEGEGTFLQKLENQLSETAPAVKLLSAEMLWFMLLCPSNVTAAKKRDDIRQVWSWSRSEIQPAEHLLSS